MGTNSVRSFLSDSENDTPRFERNHLKDRVADLLRQGIINGKIAPGSKIIEREVAESLGVSRMPIHDALIQLEKEGLVISGSDARYVIQLTRRDINELYKVRLALEKLAAESAAENSNPENRQILNQILDEMRQAVADKDEKRYVENDLKTHHQIWHQADNQHLLKALNSMLGPIFMFVANNAENFDWTETLALHEDLIFCINSGNPQAAAESIARHVENAHQRTLNIFNARESQKTS